MATRVLRVVIAGNAAGLQGALGVAQAGISKFALAAAAGVAAAGVAITKSFNTALDIQEGTNKLQAQLGTTADEAGRLGKIAGDVYANNFGESITDAQEAIRTEFQNGLLPEDATNEQIQSITQNVLNMANVFGQDVPAITRATGQAIRTGLVDNAAHAMDILTRAFQQGGDKAEDLLDTWNEYGTQVRKLGLDAEQFSGILVQGLQHGARDSDLVADALKELSIRAVDGSTTTAGGFEAMGLSASDMAAKFAAGGDTATGALDQVLDGLRGIQDPVKRSQTAVALFGTQAEDLGDALYALDPDKAVQALGKVGGAADEASAAMGKGFGAQLETIKRKLQVALANVLGKYVLPALTKFATLLANYVGPALQRVGRLVGAFVDGFKGEAEGGGAVAKFGAKVREVFEAIRVIVGRVADFIRSTVIPTVLDLWRKAQPTLNQLWNTFKTVFAAIVVAVQTAVAIIRNLWQRFGQQLIAHLKTAFDAIMQVLRGAFQVIQGIANVFIAIFTGKWGKAWNGIKQILQGVWNIITGIVRYAINYISYLIGAAMAVISAVWSRIWNAIKSVLVSIWEGIKNAVSSAIGAVSGAISYGMAVIRGIWEGLWNGLKDFVGGIWDKIKTGVSNGLGGIKSAMQTVWDGIKEVFAAPVRFVVNTVIDDWILGGINSVGSHFGFQIPLIPRLATGGVVQGPGTGTSDSILGVDRRGVPTAAVSAGEFIVNERTTRTHLPFLQALNAGLINLPQYASGGYVDKPNGPKGGVLGDIWNATGGKVVSGVANAASSVGGWLEDIMRKGAGWVVDHTLKPIAEQVRNAMGRFGTAGEFIGGMPVALIDKFSDWIKGKEANGELGGLGHMDPGGTGIARIEELALSSGFNPSFTSTFRPNAGWHGAGRAVDMVASDMNGLATWWFQHYGSSLLELIHADGFQHNVKDGRDVGDGYGFYGADTMAQHGGSNSHVHVALRKGGTLRRASRVLVGEEEPEILDLPGGSRVTPLSKAGMGGTSVTVIVQGSVISERDLVRVVQDGIAADLKRKGKPTNGVK